MASPAGTVRREAGCRASGTNGVVGRPDPSRPPYVNGGRERSTRIICRVDQYRGNGVVFHRAGSGVGWPQTHSVKVHGLAGNRESRAPGIGARVERFLSAVLRQFGHETTRA